MLPDNSNNQLSHRDHRVAQLIEQIEEEEEIKQRENALQ
jgi:hypothetical protein